MENFFGRKIIYTSRIIENIESIVNIVNGAMLRHEANAQQIDYLEKYFTGKQPILEREKIVRPDVNNKILVNNAYSIVRNANGYFLGEPINYASKDAKCRENVELLNNMMDDIDKSCGDTQLGEWQSICGTAYRLVCVDENAENSDPEVAPFSLPILDPKYTAVIYSTDAEHKPVLAFTYCDILNDSGFPDGRRYTVYDAENQYIFESKNAGGAIKPEDLVSGFPRPHGLGDVPIIEYPNNQWRLGDFETVLSILDGLNKLQSDRINSVEQLVNSILVFVNCELKEKGKDGRSDLERLREQLAISITSNSNQPADIKFVNSRVDQNEAETLAETLIDYVYAVTGIPDRKMRSNGGGDTGEAVYLRDGWASLEVVARIKERYFRRAEKQMLKIICQILNVFRNMALKPMHIEPTFVRNRTNNLLNKAQAMAVLKELEFIDPVDIVTLGRISDNPIDLVKRGLAYYAKQKSLTEKVGAENDSNKIYETDENTEY